MAQKKANGSDLKDKKAEEEEKTEEEEEAEEAYEQLKKSLSVLRLLNVQCTFILIITFIVVAYMLIDLTLAFALGAVIGVIGIIILFVASIRVTSGSDVTNAVGAAFLFIGTGIGCTGALALDNILTVMVLMVFGPVAFAMYEVGSCIITVETFVKWEGKDFAPSLEDMSEYIGENLRVVLMMVMVSFLLGIGLMTFAAMGSAALFTNSLALTGLLLGTVIAGASLLLLMKGGRMPKEKIDEEETQGVMVP